MRIRESFASALALAFCISALAGCGGGSVRSAIPTAQERTPADDCNVYQSVHRSGASSSRSPLYTQCPTGGDPGSGTGGGSGGGGGDCVSAGTCPKTSCTDDPTQAKCQVALLNWATGAKCGDSFAGIGENIPFNTTDAAHEVANIDKIAFVNGGTQVGPYGYIYKDNNGQMYIQESPSYNGNFWVNLAGVIPVIGELVKVINENGSKNATEPISEDDLQKIKASVSSQQPGMNVSVTGCFKNVPPGTQTIT